MQELDSGFRRNDDQKKRLQPRRSKENGDQMLAQTGFAVESRRK